MFMIRSEEDLLETFRPLDRGEVIPPTDLEFPLFVKDYLSWCEPSGARVYLVFADVDPRRPLGISFRRDSLGGAAAVGMCEWCHSVRAGDGVRLLTARASERRRVGLFLCADLSCKQKADAAPAACDLPRSAGDHAQGRRILARMSEFARRHLF